MPDKAIRETEKVAVGAIRTALQTWLAPQLSTISERLTHVEARLDGMDKRLDGMDRRLDGMDKRIDSLEKHLQESLTSFRNETRSEFATVHSEIRRLDQFLDLRERLAIVEAKLVSQQG